MRASDMNFKFYFSVEHGVRSYLQTMLPLVELKISLLFLDCILMGSKYFDNFVYVPGMCSPLCLRAMFMELAIISQFHIIDLVFFFLSERFTKAYEFTSIIN